MTGDRRKERDALDRLADALVEDILNTPNEDILAEFRQTEDDPERHAADMRALFEKSFVAANKQRLAAARVGVAASRRPTVSPAPVTDIARARALLRAALDAPDVQQKLTLAARKESELSDSDLHSILDDLRELGVLPPEDGEDSKV